ncbi:tRNA (adenosine(37)-N6)-threonylcarbamoyltransferase complex dimerization subunit type 1 TsaB [uncultured Maritimibacter sp.]|uniref:tRNA (adenosine(37)-N6)-threonylcarbamoyltransferase complex dimerization subunit type 1 TsaB n=1 Tax=uncultured Maritimibacter sp. TaxID=991866 RepID=UPI002591C20B|nr:tRNA (adenosine(37)-N6)-threonylcarbamoyltransferase complex dimerization subunit type 1 TsaB [uncultured Maritimibacter sp.]
MRSDPTILAFDTSAAHCAAALLVGGAITQVTVEAMAKGQAERLMPLLQDVMTTARLSFDDLDAVAVGVGPGNFTGIRIAVSAARGLALGLGKPAIGVSTLEAQALGHPRPCRAVADARRGMVYVQEFGGGDTMPRLDAADAAGDDHPVAGPVPAETLVTRIAQIAADRLASGAELARPAPLYIRGADAAPASDPPPVILP